MTATILALLIPFALIGALITLGEAGRCAPGTSAAGKDARADKTEPSGEGETK